MSKNSVPRIVCMGVPIVVWLTAVGTIAARPARTSSIATSPISLARSQDQTLMGSARCAECHESMHRTWTGARHAKMLQPATPASVLGDFSQSAVTLRGTRFGSSAARECATRSAARFRALRDEVHRVDYTLGSRRVQHYLTTLPDGRIVVLPPTWDVQRREWFHSLDIVNPDEATQNPVQVWNSNCFGCHVSAQEKGYDPARPGTRRRWTDFGTNCERCHGPGAAHAANYKTGKPDPVASATPRRPPWSSRLVSPPNDRRWSARSAIRCATSPCRVHGGRRLLRSLRSGARIRTEERQRSGVLARRPAAPVLERRDRVLAERLFRDGSATCATCHTDPHEPDIDRNPQLARTNNGLCALVPRADRERRHHATRGMPPASTGSSCVACHMPSDGDQPAVAHAGPHDQRPGAREHRSIRHSERVFGVPPGKRCRNGR